jgi:YesN/AraC family two-component response regulator
MLKVFIADDSDAVRERLYELVSDVAGVTVIGEASDGSQALDGIENSQPDVLILDIRMPQLNGFDVLDILRAGSLQPIVIVLTAFAYRQYRERCLEAGASYFFDKATEFERIADVLQKLRSQAGGGTPLCRLGALTNN